MNIEKECFGNFYFILKKHFKRIWLYLKENHKRVWLGLGEPCNRFRVFLIPSWSLFAFFFLAFLTDLGCPPKTPSNKYELVYLVVAFICFVLPFVSRIKAGPFEADMKPTEGEITLKQIELEEKEGKGKPKTAMEYKILNTLWRRQVRKFPDLNKYFMFKIERPSPEFVIAGNHLTSEGLIRNRNDYFVLTKKGLKYCDEHYPEFPDDMWFGYKPFEHNLEKVQKIIKSWGDD